MSDAHDAMDRATTGQPPRILTIGELVANHVQRYGKLPLTNIDLNINQLTLVEAELGKRADKQAALADFYIRKDMFSSAIIAQDLSRDYADAALLILDFIVPRDLNQGGSA